MMQKPEGKMYSHKDEFPKCFTSASLEVFLQIQMGLFLSYFKYNSSIKAEGLTQTKAVNVHSSNIYTNINFILNSVLITKYLMINWYFYMCPSLHTLRSINLLFPKSGI